MIEVDNISFGYGSKNIITDFSLKICDNDRFCFFAPSGKGKTTLLRLLCGLNKPTKGKINGINNIKFSIVFQEDRLIPQKTVIENIELFSEKSTEPIIEKLQLNEFKNSYPRELSGGLARRTAIARALSKNFDVLILDEPFTGLDRQMTEITAELINKYTENKTLLLVTHSPKEAELLNAKVINI